MNGKGRRDGKQKLARLENASTPEATPALEARSDRRRRLLQVGSWPDEMGWNVFVRLAHYKLSD